MLFGHSTALEAIFLDRAYLYELFHKVFGGSPNEELLSCLSSDMTLALLERYENDWGSISALNDVVEALRGLSNTDCLNMLKTEYSSLFWGLGEVRVYPWESTYVTHEPVLFQRSTLQIRAAYRHQNLEARHIGCVPDDHISLMCSFMATMSERIVLGIRARDEAKITKLLYVQESFAKEHLANWVDRFAGHLSSEPNSILLPQMAKLLAIVVDNDLIFFSAINALLKGVGGSSSSEQSDPEDGKISINTLEIEKGYNDLKGIHLFGIEENELVEVHASCPSA